MIMHVSLIYILFWIVRIFHTLSILCSLGRSKAGDSAQEAREHLKPGGKDDYKKAGRVGKPLVSASVLLLPIYHESKALAF